MLPMSATNDVTPGFQFASDNTAGICPEAWQALEQANTGFTPGYGEDTYTQRAADLIRDLFETDCEVFFTFNGTAANSLILATLCRSYHSAVCSSVAHVETDECGGPEFFAHGIKLLTADHQQGLIIPDEVTRIATQRTDIHYPKTRALTITQPTELGTVYSLDELKTLCDTAKQHDLLIHMDGARFANALVSLDRTPAEMTWKRGVDVLSLGSTKLGSPVGDAVVFFNRDLADEFDYRCKQAGQLASKMRFLAAPWVGLYQSGAYRTHAAHANAMAKQLAENLQSLGLEIAYPTHVNAVFVHMPQPLVDALHARGWHFYGFIGGAQRLMCSWATTPQHIDALTADIQQALA